MENNNAFLILAGGVLAWLLFGKKKDTAAKTATDKVSDNSGTTPATQAVQPAVNYNTYNEYNTYEQPQQKSQEVILPPVEDQSTLKVIQPEPVYIAPIQKPADFPTVKPPVPDPTPVINDVTPYKTQPVTTTTKAEPVPAPAPVVVPSTIREQSSVLTASIKGVDGTIQRCLVRPNLGLATHRASRIIYRRIDDQVRVFAITDNYLIREYGNYGFHKESL